MCDHSDLKVYINYCRVYIKKQQYITTIIPETRCHGLRACRLICSKCKKLFAIKVTVTHDKDIVSIPEYHYDTGDFDGVCDYFELEKMANKYKFSFGQYEHLERDWHDYYKFLEPLLKEEPDFVRQFDLNTCEMSGPSQKEIELVGKLDAEIPYDYNKFMEWFVHQKYRQQARINDCWLD